MAPIVPKNKILFFFLIFVPWIYSPVAAIPFRKNEVYGENTINRNWRPTLTRDRESLPDYQPLCQSINQRVDLHEPDYEFRPPFYHSIECKHTANKLHHRGHQDGSQICLQSGLSCVQRTKTIQLAKRKIGTSCWTLFSKEIHSGCECMWPVQTNGDSKHRFT
ncbi:hypothetical protein DAPPUDRAFT_304317 [Daphnia pulex]|uniref:Spaetzle domain-containing protein n=1 Tax=Daphnia pulex TaxID=6669 RepID=E9GL82_DAPPU|nr:hypothetical protein DAPPUDRAFT_304317 [Daphnia pulex]|eukprot:EFX79809.1 hypothetical protein DAPPUDRAFT_304317 [Daphnia pulex]